MEKHSFVKDNTALFIFEPVLILVFIILSSIYQINIEFELYVICFSLIIWGVLMFFQNKAYKKKLLILEKQKEAEEEDYDIEELRWRIIREKEDFFAMWAHQIKTPIAAMNVLLQSEELEVSTCKQELFKIENYVEMALNYLRFESMGNDMVLVGCDLKEMTKQVVKKFSTIFIHKHIAVKLEDLERIILTDEKWFMFVLEQILSNALKYTNEGCITISSREEKGKRLIEIKDTGIGIRHEDIPRLFEKGFTGYNGRMDKKASGLGLYLCKGVCDKLGHGITISSIQSEGTTVTLSVLCEKVNKIDLTKM